MGFDVSASRRSLRLCVENHQGLLNAETQRTQRRREEASVTQFVPVRVVPVVLMMAVMVRMLLIVPFMRISRARRKTKRSGTK
jgi:uncharacterized membrane protein YdfJ with MMPL/SSD domain